MKVNKLTPGHNLLWESSRMVLPEHVEALIKYRKESLKQIKPDLDDQKLDEISSIIQESYYNRVSVKITVFDEYKEQQFVGVVTQLDSDLKRLKLKNMIESI